jgi:hypothetical protein
LLTVLLLFNWFGYKLVLNYLQQEADMQLEVRIDADDYDESQLLEIRVPLNMPYQPSSMEYERHYGEIEIDGKSYTYVKRKIEAGCLVLKCLPNLQRELIKNTANEFYKAINGIDQENGKATSPFVKLLKCLPGDFDDDAFSFQFNTFFSHVKNCLTPQSTFINAGFASICEQPPDA